MSKTRIINNTKPVNVAPPHKFIDLVELFVGQFYPNTIKIIPNQNDKFVLKANYYNDSVVITSISIPDTSNLKKRIVSDIQVLIKSKFPHVTLIYLIDIPSEKIITDYSSFGNTLSQNGYRVLIFDELHISEVLIRSYKPPPQINSNSLLSYYESLNDIPCSEQPVIEEIFNFVHASAKTPIDIIPFESKFLPLKSKIQENFIPALYHEVYSILDINWITKSRVEFFIRTNFEKYENQFYEILSKIHYHYKSLESNHKHSVEFPVNEPMIFEQLSMQLIPPDKQSDFRYTSVAKSIVLFFFEYCDFGKKSIADPPTLFPKCNKDYDNPE